MTQIRYSLAHEHIMSGLIKCPVCGSGMIGSVSRRINKKTGENKDDFYYRCMSRKKYDGVHFCKYNKTFNQKKVEAEMINLISLCATNIRENKYVSELLDDRVDIERMEKERDQLTKELKQVSGAKDKLSEMLDKLDVSDRHYERKYADMTKRLDDLYDKINGMEQNVENINICLEEAAARKVSAKNVYEILGKFDKVYDKMTDPEKKKFYRALIQEIEIHDDREKQSDPILKKVHFRIPLAINGQLGDCVMLSKNSTVETVALLSKLSEAKHHIEVKVDMDELDLTSAEAKATYKEIQDWVQEKYGFHVTNMYIAQVKQKYGLIERENYNKPKSPNSRQPGCPEEKVKAIEDAMRHFQMI